MPLQFGEDLFGQGLFDNTIDDSLYVVSAPLRSIDMFMPGHSGVGSITMGARALDNATKTMGFLTTITLLNVTGASRDVTFMIENLTKGTTLLSGSITIGGFAGTTGSWSWSLEKLGEGDSIKFTIGDEGVGTAANASRGGYYEFELSAFYQIRTGDDTNV